MTKRTFLVLLAAVVLSSASAQAHVHLIGPNGGEVYAGGAPVNIQWQVVIQHSTVGWDLEYSLNGAAGPWMPIALGLAPGNVQAGAVHSYLWNAPLLTTNSLRIRVRMVNNGTNYLDISDGNITVETSLQADVNSVSVAAGGVQTLTLSVDASHFGELYAVLGSVTGTSPGVAFQGQIIPLNPDFYFNQTINFPNQHPLAGSLGNVDASGGAVTTVTVLPGELPPVVVGLVIHHAAVVLDGSFQLSHVSNAVPLTLVP
ncbi:MAG TPA: hypothetical protein ENK43_04285 [Planctomycetes bacterium]|nr:hypothetical protein [Planctomycetota bacterium]